MVFRLKTAENLKKMMEEKENAKRRISDGRRKRINKLKKEEERE